MDNVLLAFAAIGFATVLGACACAVLMVLDERTDRKRNAAMLEERKR